MPDAARFVGTPAASAGVLLTEADFEALERELELLRNRHRAEFARSLRDARAFGSPGENDDVLTVFEEAAVNEARIAQPNGRDRELRVIEVISRVTDGLPSTAKAA
jgi:transcription elongation GreA/GreB family factor